MSAPFRYGVSLYVFTEDYGAVLDLDDALADIADLGATGVQILGEAHVATYPEPSSQWRDGWFERLDRFGLEATTYGCWTDTRLHLSRDLPLEDALFLFQRDLRLAASLGFRIVKPKLGIIDFDLTPHPIWEPMMERSLDLAASLGLVIAPEIHSPTPIRSRVVENYVAFAERHGGEHFGLTLDTGLFQNRPLPYRTNETPGVPRHPVVDGLGIDPAEIRDVARHVKFVEAKFWHVDDDLVDANVPWQAIVRELKQCGYAGYLSSEWEGYLYRDPAAMPERATDQVRRQHALVRLLEREHDAAVRAPFTVEAASSSPAPTLRDPT